MGVDDGGTLDACPLLPAEVSSRLLTPALVVWMDAVRHNVRLIQGLTGGRWRPHLKTTKMAGVWRELVRHGISSFKVATVKELQVLLRVLREAEEEGGGCEDGGRWDVLVAYPVRGPHLSLVGRAAAECVGLARVSVLVEGVEDVAALPEHVSAFVDVNPGMNRTGVTLADTLDESVRRVQRVVGAAARVDKYRGIHFYEGHLVWGEDRDAECERAYEWLVDLHSRCESAAHCDEVITSGTPGFLSALRADLEARLVGGKTVHRVSPGTVVFHDGDGELQNPGLGLRPACMLVSRLVSRPNADTVTLDCGSKSLDASSGDPAATVHRVEQEEADGAWTLIGDVRDVFEARHPSEEHTPMRVVQPSDRVRALRPGEALFYLVPKHVCPTVNLAEEALVVDCGRVRVEPVAARGHGPVLLPPA